MTGQKRSLAHPAPSPSSSKRRKPSPPVVDLTHDSDDDNHAAVAPFGPDSTSSSWIHPWRTFVNHGVELFRAVLANSSLATASTAKKARHANGTAHPSPHSTPSVDVAALRRERRQLKQQLDTLRHEHSWNVITAQASGMSPPAKPQSILDLEERMKALRLRLQSAPKEGTDAGASSTGGAGYHRKKPMGSDKSLKQPPIPSRQPHPPPLTPNDLPSTRRFSPLASTSTSSRRVPRPPWALDYDPDTPRSPSPPLSPPPSAIPRRTPPATTQHKLAIAQRDAHTLADLRARSSQPSVAPSSPLYAPTCEDDDEADAPEAEDDLQRGLYEQMLEKGLRDQQAKHDATSRPSPSRRTSHLEVGRSSSSIAGRSTLDGPRLFPAASPFLRPAAPATASATGSARPALAHRRSSRSDVDRVLATARKSLEEPLRGSALGAFEEFVKVRKTLEAVNEEFKAVEVAKVKKRKFPKELPPEDAARVKAILKDSRYETSIPGAAAANKDLRRLQGLTWLNDELVNFVGVMINRRSDEADKTGERGEGERRLRKAFVFNTNFFTWYGDNGFAKVKRWTRRFDTFEKDIIIIPINHNNSHWCCAAINLKLKRFEYYDSFGRPMPFVYERLRNWLTEEHRNRKKSEIDLSDWIDYWYEDVPQQQNVSDCGVFTCMFMESLSREVDFFDFSQKNMPYLRNKMVLQIDKHDLLDVEPWV